MPEILPPPDVNKPQAPRRIQLSRAKGWRKPESAVVVSRPTRWGNPFRVVTTANRSEVWDNDRFVGQSTDPTWAQRRAVELFTERTETYDADTLAVLRRDLAGKDLACWCNPSVPCHADRLLILANGGAL